MHAMVSINKVPADPMQDLSWHVTNLTQAQYDMLCDQIMSALEQFRDAVPVEIRGSGQNG